MADKDLDQGKRHPLEVDPHRTVSLLQRTNAFLERSATKPYASFWELANVPGKGPGAAGKERVLLDPNLWSKDGSIALGRWAPSRDGKKIVYGVKPNNSDEATLQLLDVDTGKESAIDRIETAARSSPVETKALVQAEIIKWRPIIEAAGATN